MPTIFYIFVISFKFNFRSNSQSRAMKKYIVISSYSDPRQKNLK